MKLSEYAKLLGLNYRTVWNAYKNGDIPNAYQLPTGTIIVKQDVPIINQSPIEYGVVLYARTSSSNNTKLLNDQADRLYLYALAKGYKVKAIIKEFGSGLNDSRPKLSKILIDNQYDKIIVENKDRLTRFGFNWFQLLTNNRIEVINQAKSIDEDITNDLISIIHSFSARLYGQRRTKNKVNSIKNILSV